MKLTALKRLTAGALCLLMLLGQLPTTTATSQPTGPKVVWEQVDNDRVTANFLPEGDPIEAQQPLYADTDTVRVSIVLEKKATLSVYPGQNVARNTWAVSYRNALERQQAEVAAAISAGVLQGQPLDVVWNLTLAANAISANVPYGSIGDIQSVKGVKDVILEQRYAPCAASNGINDPKMSIATGMTGTTQAWSAGYTGAGTRVAIIDTGLDTDHQSVSDGAFQYSLGKLAESSGMTKENFLAEKDLLDEAELSGILTQLHAYTRSYASAADFYVSSKIPFGFNYIDANFQLTHMTDSMGDHGSHVAGIAAANRFVPQADGSFASAMDAVKMVGAAPDAQILVMKVFGAGGGAYDSDYMAAVEDAIVLGCDTVNLSLGAPIPGLSDSGYYESIMEMLERSNTIATIAASNSGYWSENSHTPTGLLYGEDVMFQTTGSPATFTNSLSVASVQNDGMVGFGFYVPDRNGHFVTYNEPGGNDRALLGSLDTGGSGTTYEFVWIDGIGQESDYAGIDLTGKVVFCSRGQLQFGQKATNAVNKGAIAVVVYNNEPGTVTMNLEGYTGTAPCISISQADAQIIRGSAVDHGTYRTGSMLIVETVSDSSWNADYHVMAPSSSWGVPGDLHMKPEITAPGGNIWSLRGTEESHDQYQVMSGTSMAAPQMAGIGALMKQAIGERQLSQPGLTDRALAQSLLMSTAVPMRDEAGEYYPILQQGAGLVNAGAAASADAYITVAGMDDGKVKVELGDDPDRTGVYDFTFTIHNLDGAERSYTLRGDVFTQDILQQYGFSWLELHTRPLEAAVTTFAVDSAAGYDFDGNGKVEADDDGQALLAYASGHRDGIFYEENADFSGDGKITTYDAHLFLAELARGGKVEVPAGGTVTVPANGTADITVTVTLDSAEMRELLTHCPNGVYVQAYIYATAKADEEGAVGTAHSIPVLGFYGNWTDPSMYDKGSYQYYHYRLYGDGVPYQSYLGNEDVNTFMVTYSGNNIAAYALGGNPVNLVDEYGTPVQLDRDYLESRNALNNAKGDAVYSLRHAAIRNSIATRFTVTDANTGALYYTDEEQWIQYSAYYNPNTAMWESTNYSPYIGWAGTDQYGYLLPENTVVNLSYTRAPEYYANEDGTVRWDDLGRGATFTTQLTIDNTAPQLISASAANNDLTVKVHDNQYVAAVVLLDPLGQRQLSYAGGNQMQKNVQTDVVLHVDGIVGKSFMLQVYDYAMNVSTYQVTVEGMEPTVSNYYTGYDHGDGAWYGISETGETGLYALDGRNIYAAERVDDLVFAVDSTQDNTANLYVMPADDLAKIEAVGVIHSPHAGETFYITDMAYHYPDQTMYFVYYCSHSDYKGCYGLATVDLLTGQADFDSCGPLGADLRGLAIDEDGTFYGVGDNYRLYTYTKTTFGNPQSGTASIGSLTGSPTRISLTWDAKKDELVMADHRSEGRTLYTVDPDSFTAEICSDTAPGTLWGLHMDSGLSSGQNFATTATPTEVRFAEQTVKVLRGATCQLSASAYPWTLTDRAVRWSSNDSSIASVDQEGVVTGNALGSCTVTATSVLDASVSASCTVEVTNINADLTAILRESGAYRWAAFNTDNPAAYQTQGQSDAKLVTAVYADDGWIYGATWNEEEASSNLYRVNPETLAESYVGSVALRGYSYEVVDLADAPNLGDGKYLVGVSSQNIMVLNRNSGAIVGVVSSDMGLSTPMIGITYAGKLEHPQNGTYDTYYAVDYYGKVYWVGLQVESVASDGILTLSIIGKTADYVVAQTNLDTDYAYYYNSLHYTLDNSGMPFLFWSYYKWGNAVQMIAIDADKSGAMAYLGTFPRYVYPVGGLMDSDVPAFSQTAAEAVTVRSGVNDLETFHIAKGQPESAVTLRNTDGETFEKEAAALFRPSSASAVRAAGTVAGRETGSGGNVELTLTAGKPMTNGLLRIAYDAEVLTFAGARGNTRLYTVKQESDGLITLGYADGTAIPSGTELSGLSFTARKNAFETDITVTVAEDGDKTAGTEQVTVPVIRAPKKHTVTFNLNGGEGKVPDNQTVTDGEKVQKPADPVRSGYSFRYWSTARSGSAYSFNTPVTGDLTLYAIWEAIPTEPTEPETEPTEAPTEPETEPTEAPTEPETKPTEPKPTDPKPTEPKPTEPKPTEPKPTEPKPQAPQCSKDNKCPLAQFDDVIVKDWYHDGIHFCVEEGIMNGMGEGKFAPNEPTTRAQLVTMLYRLEGEPTIEGKTEPFADVAETDWFYAPIVWACNNGVVNGISNTEFAPNANVTREQVATILHRYLGKPQGTGNLVDFPDASSVSGYAVEALSWAVGAKLITGVAQPDGTALLDPAGNATRAQIATILMRHLTA